MPKRKEKTRKKRGGQKLNVKNIKISSNIISFISNVVRTFKNNPKFLIISITPYTFLTMLILFLFRKKTFLYLDPIHMTL